LGAIIRLGMGDDLGRDLYPDDARRYLRQHRRASRT
jgi:hypothetical protein